MLIINYIRISMPGHLDMAHLLALLATAENKPGNIGIRD
jgi:hypothetical protein